LKKNGRLLQAIASGLRLINFKEQSIVNLSVNLMQLAEAKELDRETYRSLSADLLADPRRARAFGITPETVESAVQRRVELLQAAYPALKQQCDRGFGDWLQTAWDLWLPLALQLRDRQAVLSRPFVQGILGGQGTGKSTLCQVLVLLLKFLSQTAIALSIDDLYKTYVDRQRLQVEDPRLVWRGPPGTHDVALGLQVLKDLRQTGQAALPRFDKSLHQGFGDRISPELVTQVDIVLFEGWFVGARPIPVMEFDSAPDPIVTEDDRAFARDMNTNLRSYLPLWERLDSLIVLRPVDYRLSKTWRKQAEQAMRATGKAGMSDAEIEAFVEYFWKALHPDWFIQPLVNSTETDLVIEIDKNHRSGAVFRGGDA
jgi:D-glycerate 3-kinase